MPKCYSDQEKTYIRNRLKQEAADCLAQYGIRRTTVDEIVRRASLPKGTFYLFYKSKELLLFEVLTDQQQQARRQLEQAVRALGAGPVTCEQLTELIFGLYKQTERLPALQLLNSDEIHLLALKLPPEVLQTHFDQDSADAGALLAGLPGVHIQNPAPFSAAFRAIFMLAAHKREIGAQEYDSVLKLLIRGLALQMLE